MDCLSAVDGVVVVKSNQINALMDTLSLGCYDVVMTLLLVLLLVVLLCDSVVVGGVVVTLPLVLLLLLLLETGTRQ